jgi:TonB family protein
MRAAKNRVAPDLIRGPGARAHQPSSPRPARSLLPAALALAATLAFPAPASAQKQSSAGEQRVSVLVDLTVAPDGKVVGCDVTQSSGQPALDAKACETLSATASFKPVKFRFDRLIPQRMTFVLTDGSAPAPAPAQ